jgi:hypothetical protein
MSQCRILQSIEREEGEHVVKLRHLIDASAMTAKPIEKLTLHDIKEFKVNMNTESSKPPLPKKALGIKEILAIKEVEKNKKIIKESKMSVQKFFQFDSVKRNKKPQCKKITILRKFEFLIYRKTQSR